MNLPPGIVCDENRDGVAALRVLQGEHAIFFTNVVHQGQEPWTIYALALSTLLFGRTLFAMHFPTALGSAGMVFAAFWLGRLLFGRDEEGEQATPWRGLLVGGVGAGLMAVSVGQTILGRTAYSKITYMPLLLTLSLGLLWWGWKERSWWRVALAGACAGLLAVHLHAGSFCAFSICLFWFELSAVPARCQLGKGAPGVALGSRFCRRGRTGGSAAARPFCIESRTLFLAQQVICGYSILWSVRGTRWGPF